MPHAVLSEWHIMGKKTPESSRALEAKAAALYEKRDNSGNESLFPDDSLKLTIEIIQPLTGMDTAPDRAMQISDVKRR